MDPSVVVRIEQADCTIDYCPDVYRALAGMGRLQPAAVIVAIDWLPESEFEFFRILHRRWRELPAFVLGADRSRSKIERAIEAGATGVLTEEALTRCLADFHRAPSEATTGPPPMPATSPSEQTPNKKPDAFAPADNVFDTENASEKKRRVRVPWVRYSGGPQRVPPPGGPSAPPPRLGASCEEDAPLLSPEEIEALLGDDTASRDE